MVSIALIGPSTTPGAPANTPGIINTAVNAALAQLLPLTGGTLSGSLAQALTVALASNTANDAASSGILATQIFNGTDAVATGALLNSLTINDHLNWTGSSNGVTGLEVLHNYGPSNVGGRTAFWAILNQTAATTDLADNFYVGATFQGIANFNNGGTGLTGATAKGRVFGANPTVHLKSGATNYYQATALELDTAIDTGASAAIKVPLTIASLGAANAVQGSVVDAGIWFYKSNGAPIKTAILIGGGGGLNNYPIDPAGSYISDDTTGTTTASTAYGLHFTGAFTTASIAVPGFTVDGTGRPTAFSTLFLTPTGGFGTIDPGSGTLLLKSGSTGSNGTVQALSPFTAPTLAATRNIAFSGAPSTSAGGVRLASTLTGSLTTGQQPYMAIVIQNDAVAQTSTSSTVQGLGILHTVAAGATGNRWMVDASTSANVASTDLHLGAHRGTVTASVNLGGTGTSAVTANGNLFGANFVTQAFSGATNLAGVNALELDSEMRAGSSAYAKIGLNLVQLSNDAVQGAVDDQAISFNNQAAPVAGQAWLSLIGVGRNGGFPPLDPTSGWIMTCTAHLGAGTVAAAGGLDFTNFTPATAFMRGTNFLLDPSGNFTANSHKVGANQVVGARITGWGAGSNGSRAALNGSTATLAQTSAALAQLIIDLTTHGLIGP